MDSFLAVQLMIWLGEGPVYCERMSLVCVCVDADGSDFDRINEPRPSSLYCPRLSCSSHPLGTPLAPRLCCPGAPRSAPARPPPLFLPPSVSSGLVSLLVPAPQSALGRLPLPYHFSLGARRFRFWSGPLFGWS